MPEFDVFAQIIDTYGEPQNATLPSPECAQRYRGRVPDGLIRFWQDHGFGTFRQGRFWISDPQLLEGVVTEVFRDDERYQPSDIVAVGYSAFGDLICRDRTHFDLDVDFHLFTVFEPGSPDNFLPPELRNVHTSPDFRLGLSLQNEITDDFALIDDEGDDMLPPAIARLGPLEPGEIYGFFPALGFGGERKIETLRRVNVVEPLLFLAQLGPFTLQRMTEPSAGLPFGESATVRTIGGR